MEKPSHFITIKAQIMACLEKPLRPVLGCSWMISWPEIATSSFRCYWFWQLNYTIKDWLLLQIWSDNKVKSSGQNRINTYFIEFCSWLEILFKEVNNLMGKVFGNTHTQQQLNNYANQRNSNNSAYRANNNNHADQLNPNNHTSKSGQSSKKSYFSYDPYPTSLINRGYWKSHFCLVEIPYIEVFWTYTSIYCFSVETIRTFSAVS